MTIPDSSIPDPSSLGQMAGSSIGAVPPDSSAVAVPGSSVGAVPPGSSAVAVPGSSGAPAPGSSAGAVPDSSVPAVPGSSASAVRESSVARQGSSLQPSSSILLAQSSSSGRGLFSLASQKSSQQSSKPKSSGSSGSSGCVENPQDKKDWAEAKEMVSASLDFWASWLREGEDGKDAENPCPNLMMCVMRAISFNESRYGKGSGNQPARDPMQVGNPGDVAWQNIGVNTSSAPGNRLVRQGALPGMSWAQTAVNVNSIINGPPAPSPPKLPFTIDPLLHPSNGHNSPQFTKEMSYFWGTAWFLYGLQQVAPAGKRAAWRFGDCDPGVLFKAARHYNGTGAGAGDQEYARKLKEAMKRSCCWSKFEGKVEIPKASGGAKTSGGPKPSGNPSTKSAGLSPGATGQSGSPSLGSS